MKLMQRNYALISQNVIHDLGHHEIRPEAKCDHDENRKSTKHRSLEMGFYHEKLKRIERYIVVGLIQVELDEMNISSISKQHKYLYDETL